MTGAKNHSLQFEPLEQWPDGQLRTDPGYRRRGPFRATYSDTLDLLDHELRQIGAESVVLQVDIAGSNIRLDGLPYANARIGGDEPGVVLSFEAGGDSFMYPCDSYLDWRDNLRAIALTLEKLRAVDRYGVAQRGEQYVGWKAIPEDVDRRLSAKDAARIIARTAGVGDGKVEAAIGDILGGRKLFQAAYRQAAGYAHPDRPGGTEAAFHRLQTARGILEEHHR